MRGASEAAPLLLSHPSATIRNTVEERIRRQFTGTQYPNDEEEMTCLDKQHEIFRTILNGKFFLAPIPTSGNILDIGTGSGIWALDVADRYPALDVTGIDISPTQPISVPPNCTFVVEDANGD